MTNIGAIFIKDLKSYFCSMTAYIMMTIFLLLCGFFFATALSYYSIYSFQLSSQPNMPSVGLNLTDAVLGNLFFNFSVILLLMIPILTMRTIAEEQKQGTFELLLTYPLNEFELVIGKFLALTMVFLVMLAPTGLYLALLRHVGGVFEWGVVFAGYAGILLLGFAFLTLGIFASSLTESQIVSAVITFGFLLLLWMIAWVSDFLPPQLSVWVNELSLIRHVEDFFKGVVELKHLIFYGLFGAFFLLLTMWRIETRRWVR